MKSVTLLTTLILGLCASSHAAVYEFDQTFNSGFQNSGVILDGNTSGWFDTHTVSGLTGSITSVSVNLTVTGGYNGDVYAYLSYNGVLIPLLNRVGVSSTDAFGSAASGMTITLADSGLNGDIHTYAGLTTPTGAYSPDGRMINPVTGAPVDFDAAGTKTFANTFGGMTPNGDWTLFFSDVSGGGGNSTISSWSLDIITAVPEPINIALGVFGGLFAVGSVVRSQTLRKMFAKPEPVEID
jgi:hypothetical protein